MTEIDTSAEAVERDANSCDALSAHILEEYRADHVDGENVGRIAKLLRALAAERDAATKRADGLHAFVEDFAAHTFKETRQFSGPAPYDEVDATTEFAPVGAFQDDARGLITKLKGGA